MKNCVLSILLLFSCSLFSQTDTVGNFNKLSEMSLEELLDVEVFSASKKLQRSSDAPAIMNVITQAQIKKMGAVTLVDVLKYVPGLEVSMGSDGFYRVAIRGARKDGDILVLIDGQQFNDFYGGRALYDLPIDFIEKIEIIRGPGSALYGTNAMAGVINIFTSKKANVSIGGGINSTVKANVNLHKEKNETKFSLSIGGLSTKGANQLIDTDKVEDRTWSLTHRNAKFETNRWNQDFYVNANLSIEDLSIKLFNIYRQQGAYVGPVFIAAPDSRLITNQFLGSVSYGFKVGDNVIITPKVYSNINYADFLSQEAPDKYISPVSNSLFDNGKLTREKRMGKTYGSSMDIYIKANENVDLLTGSIFEDLSMSNYELTRNYKIVGDEYKGTFSNYDNIPYNQIDKRRFVFAYFLQGTYKTKKLNVTAGLRYDDYNDFGQSFNPRVGVTYKVSKCVSIKGLLGKAFRAPTFQELYDNTTLGNDVGVKGNSSLTPEKINTYELETEIKFTNVFIKYNVFYNQNRNLIRVYDPHGGGSIGMYENIGDLTTYGNEAEIDVKITKGLHVFANYSHLLSAFSLNEDKAKKADITFFSKQAAPNKLMYNSPNMRLNAGVHLILKKFQVFAGVNYGNKCENNVRFYLEQDHFANIPYYLQANANVSYEVTKKFKVNIVCNSLGKKYSDPDESTNINAFGRNGLIQPGKSVLLNLDYKF